MNTKHRKANVFWRSPLGLTLVVFLAVAALLLALEHSAHLLGAWPLLLLLLCVGMHFFMHRSHGRQEPRGDLGGTDGGEGDADGR